MNHYLPPPHLAKTLLAALVLLACVCPLGHAGQSLVCLIQPSKTAEIGTSVYGVIERIPVERGDLVKKGQVIAILRNDVERAALDVAKNKALTDADVQAAIANVAFTRQRLNRAADLVKKEFLSEQALEQNRVDFQVAEQKLALAREQRRIWVSEKDLAQSQLAQRTLHSPMDGIVSERFASTGERVENRSVARVVSINPLFIEVMVPAVHFGKITTGMSAAVTPELPNMPALEATVNLVDRLIDGASNTFRVRLELPNSNLAIPAGPRCKVDFGDQVVAPAITRTKLNGTMPTNSPSPSPATSLTLTPSLTLTRPAAQATQTAPAPAQDTPTKITPPPPSNTKPGLKQSLRNALEDWRKAWENQDLLGALTSYMTRLFAQSSPHRSAHTSSHNPNVKLRAADTLTRAQAAPSRSSIRASSTFASRRPSQR